MKPAPFEYHAPTTVEDVTALLAEHGDDAKVIAGGQSLVPLLNMRLARFDALVDLRRVENLQSVSVEASGTRLGAMVRQCDVEERADVAAAVPLLAKAVPFIGHFQIRSRGTVVGSIAHADPAAECPAVALALDAELHVVGTSGSRVLAAGDFFLGPWTTALEPAELLAAVTFPNRQPGSGFAVDEVARRHGDFAIAGACVAVDVSDDTITSARIALFGMGATPVRAADAENAAIGRGVEDDFIDLGLLAVESLDPPDDLHASSALRRRIGAHMVTRAVRSAVEDATRG